MSTIRQEMDKALKELVVPILRQNGFKGSFPHSRRISDTQIDLLTFQFNKWGGSFIIEISKCSPEGHTTHWGEKIPPNKVKAWDLHPDLRHRLARGNDWFRYDKKSFLPFRDIYKAVAKSTIPRITKDAEKWWNSP